MSASFRFTRAAGRGMTLLEAMVSVTLITLVVMTCISVITSTSDHMRFELVVSDQQNQARSAMDEMMEDLRKMSATVADFNTEDGNKTHTVTGGNGVDQVTFAIPYFDGSGVSSRASEQDVAAYGAALATDITYRWAINPREIAGNGLDDDGNNLFDERDGRIERLVGGLSTSIQVVCDNVPREGFLVVKSGRRLQIRVARLNNTPLVTQDGTRISTVVTHNTYCLRNY